MSWDSSRYSRKQVINLIKNNIRDNDRIRILEGGIYENMPHRVDRVIKERDVMAIRIGD